MFCTLIMIVPRQILAVGDAVKQITDKTKYVDQYFEVNQNGQFKLYVYLGDQKIATIDNDDNYFNLDNHLSSHTIITNPTGQIVETNDYDDYGSVIHSESSINNDYKFTGKEFDTETGLQYFGQRYYDSDVGRFASIDPLLISEINQFLSDPQQLNSYSYSRNNPISLVDKTGEKVSEFQPYYSSSGFYEYRQDYGKYRGMELVSAGEYSGQGWHDYQCVDWVKKFVNDQYKVELGSIGNANFYSKQSSFNDFNKSHDGQYTVYKNNSSIMPQENDILTWSGGDYGHVGIIAEVSFDGNSNIGYVYTLEQNYSGKQGLYSQSFVRSYNDSGQPEYTVNDRGGLKVQGWARYSQQTSIPYSNILYTPAPGNYIYE